VPGPPHRRRSPIATIDLTLYRAVGNLNRVALGDLATSEYYWASKDSEGVITLTPVNIVGASKRGQADPLDQDPIPGTADDEQTAPFEG